jgi:hypothetical protein
MSAAGEQPRNLWRSTGAILLGVVAVVVLSLLTDQLFHVLGVYPPWGEPFFDTGLNVLALSYRCVYSVIGSWIAARFAPRNPMRHALVLGVVGTVLATLGAVTTIPMNLGPAWYPISLVITAMPCAWVGGALHRASRGTMASVGA